MIRRHRPLPLLATLAAAALAPLVACADEPAPPFLEEGAAPAPVVPDGCEQPEPARAGTTTERIDSGGDEREYLLTVPGSYDADDPAPVLLNFHGLESDADEQLEYSRLAEQADAAGFVVVTPQGGGLISNWSLPGDDGARADVAFVVDVLDEVRARLCVDEGRTFTAGISNGAAFSVVLACELAPRIAGVAAVAGVNLVATCPEGGPVPLVAFHGTEDDIVPYEGGTVLAGLAEAVPVDEAVAAWADRNGCEAEPAEEAVGDDVRLRAYPSCDDGATVELYVVDGGGHTWPGSPGVREEVLGPVTDEIDATALLLERFSEIG